MKRQCFFCQPSWLQAKKEKMKYLLIIFVNVLLISCRIQKRPSSQEITIDNLEPGKCYFTLQLENEHKIERENAIPQMAFTLKVIEPEFETAEIKYSSNELRSKMGVNEYLRVKTLEAHTKLLIKDANLSEYTTIKNPKGFMYCLVEVPAEWRTIYKKDLVQDSIIIDEKKIVQKSKIIKNYVKKNPKGLNEKQLFFESSIWSKPKEAIASGCGGYGYKIIYNIKEELIERGYDLKLNNEIDEKMKNALIDFQKKNELKEGQIDFETLEKLGIKY